MNLKTVDFSITPVQNLDLSNIDLSEIEYDDLHFINCNFKNANFKSAKLDSVCFDGCILDCANFENAVMECAFIVNCSCIETNFSKAHLLASRIESSNFTKANVSGANLLEVLGIDWNVADMIVNENTAVNDGEFQNVNWWQTDVTRLNISIEQVKWFLECATGGTKLNTYTDFKRASSQKVEDKLLSELWDLHQSSANNFTPPPQRRSTFISYASENKNLPEHFYSENSHKYPLWIDDSLNGSLKLNEQIDTLISSCTSVIIYLSKEYLQKAWTRYELMRIIEEKKARNIPVIVYKIDSSQDVFELFQSYLTDLFAIVDNATNLTKALDELGGDICEGVQKNTAE